MTTAKSLDDVTGEIVDAAYKLHTGLGPGLLESVYETVLARDLRGAACRSSGRSPLRSTTMICISMTDSVLICSSSPAWSSKSSPSRGCCLFTRNRCSPICAF